MANPSGRTVTIIQGRNLGRSGRDLNSNAGVRAVRSSIRDVKHMYLVEG